MTIAYLKILSGMHQDALVPIDHSPLIIGGAEDVDILLSDAFLKDQRFSISSAGASFFLHNSSEQLAWSKALLDVGRDTVTLYKTGELILAFAEKMAAFAQINLEQVVFDHYTPDDSAVLAQANALQAEAALDKPKAGDEHFNDARSLRNKEDEADTDDYPSYVELEPVYSEDEPAAEPKASRSKKTWISIAAAAVLVLFGVGYLSFLLSNGEKEPLPTIACDTQFKALFAKDDYSQLRLISTSEGQKYLIQGYVNDMDSYAQVKQKAAQLSCAQLGQVYVNNQIISSMQNLVPEELLSSIKVTADTLYGHVVVEGYARDAAAWYKVKNRMLRDVNGLLAIEDKVATAQTHLAYLNQLLVQYQLNGYVQLKVIGDTIVTDMVFNPSIYEKWKQVEAVYRDNYPVGPALKMDNVNITQLGITGISQGKTAHIVLENGEKYVVGSVLPNGSVLTRVDDDGLVMSTAKGEIKYPISTLF